MEGPEDTAGLRWVDALARALPQGYRLRARTEADLHFLSQLYASTREEELSVVSWSIEQKAAFLQDQFDKQHTYYLEQYPRAHWLVIEGQVERIGRIYIEQNAREVRLMDVALLPRWRKQGIGSGLMRGFLSHADSLGLPVSLHVEPFNPAIRLYQRLGFTSVEARGYYQYMERAVAAATP